MTNFFIEKRKTIGKVLMVIILIAVFYFLKQNPPESEAKSGCLYDDLYVRSDCQDLY